MTGSLALSTALSTEPTLHADSQSAVIFGMESPRHVGPPVDVTILRVNNEEYVLGLHWSSRKVWRAPAGEVQVKVLCSMEYKAFIGRRGDSQPKLLTARLEAGHYYQFTCENFEPRYVDRGTDPAAIPELTAR